MGLAKGSAAVLLTLALAMNAGGAGAGPLNFRPDMQIKKGAEPNYAGDDVYLPTAQTKSVRLARGKMIAFGVRAQNDGTIIDDYYLMGCSSSRGFIVSYFHAGMNITNMMTSNAGHNTEELQPDATYDILMRIKVRKNADSGARKSCKVVAPSLQADPILRDAVVGKVTVK